MELFWEKQVLCYLSSLLQKSKYKKIKNPEKKMKIKNFNSITQMINSMELLVMELENALSNNEAEKIKKVKSEILNLQRQIKEELEGK